MGVHLSFPLSSPKPCLPEIEMVHESSQICPLRNLPCSPTQFCVKYKEITLPLLD